MERDLPDRLAGRFGEQLEQLQELLGAVERRVRFDRLAEDPLELFAVFECGSPVLLLTERRKRWSRASRVREVSSWRLATNSRACWPQKR